MPMLTSFVMPGLARRPARPAGVVAAVLVAVVALLAAAEPQPLDLVGNDGDGYLAVVGANQEPNQSLDDISRDPNSPKFFDYPAYINPQTSANIYILSVEPYRFGLSYPDPLHPTGPGAFAPVGTLQSTGTPGATFIEGVNEDADFADFDLGTLEYEDDTLTGVGVESLGVDALTLNLVTTDFNATNRTEILAGADVPPFGPAGRSNRNELATDVRILVNELQGDGLSFEDGLLTSLDFVADITVTVFGAATTQAIPDPSPSLGLSVDGTLTFEGNTFAFAVDGQDSVGPFDDVRIVLNRSGSIPLGVAGLPGDYDASGQVEQGDLDLVLQNWGIDTGTNGVPLNWTNDLPQGQIDQGELDGVLQNWGSVAAPQIAAVPEPTVAFLLGAMVGTGWRRRRVAAGV